MCATPSSLEWVAAIKNNWLALLLNSSQISLWDNTGKRLWIILWWLSSSSHSLFLKTYGLSFGMRLHLPLRQDVGSLVLWKSAHWKCATTRRACPVQCLFLGFCPKDPEKRKHQKWIGLLLLIQLVHPIVRHWKFSGREGGWEKAKYQVNYTHALLMSKHPSQEIVKVDLTDVA